MNNKKPSDFLKKSYDENNSWGISRVEHMLIKKGYEIVDKPEDYDVDIEAILKNEFHYFEVETKRNYPFKSKDDFRFSTVSFLARKKKMQQSKDFYYIIVCRETEAFVGCHSSIIFQDKYKQKIKVNTSDRRGSDDFYRVPKNLCFWGNIKNYR